jgi:outer membrane receptor protein involved in Fe transport
LVALGAVLSLLPSGPLPAQARVGDAGVRGVVTTAQGEPVAMAVLEVRVRGDSAVIRSAQSGEAGRFQVEGLAEGVYFLMIRRIGFGPAQTPEFTVTAGAIRDLGAIRLDPAPVQLAPIVVTVERPDVAFEPDRTGYLVEALTASVGGVITDALREIPDLVVEIDGTVRLRGSTPTIYINGRPAPMQGVSLAVFMEQFPADQIERIEVLDAPPARFSAEGSTGIINIVLKEGVELGLSGSFSLAAGTRGQYTTSGRVTTQRGPLTLNGGLNARWSDSESADFTLRENLLANPTTFLQQDARSDRASRNGGISLDLRYDLSERARLSTRVNVNGNGNDRDGLTETMHLDALQAPTLRYERRARQDSRGNSVNAQVGYSYAWAPQRHTLEIEASLQTNDDANDTRDETEADPEFQGADQLPLWLTHRVHRTLRRGANLDVSYVRPWGRQGRIVVGAGWRLDDSEEDQTTSLFGLPGATVPDLVEARLVSRTQRVGSGHLTVQRRFAEFGLVGALRGEWVDEDVQLPLGVAIDRNEARLFPSLNLNWNPRPRLSARIGWSRRTNRPGVSVLDPTDRSTDPLNRRVGNPDIRSSTTQNVNLGFSWTGRLGQVSVGPYWNRTTDGWEQVTTVDASGISTTTWANLTERTSLGSSLSFGPPRYRGWNARANLSASRTTLSGSLRSTELPGGVLRWSVGANLSGPIIEGITAHGSFGYQPPRDLVQGRASGQWRADFSFRYRLMNNRTSIGLSVQDPFELRKTSQEIRDPSVIQTGSSRVTTRSMTVNVAYSFGVGRGRGVPGR